MHNQTPNHKFKRKRYDTDIMWLPKHKAPNRFDNVKFCFFVKVLLFRKLIDNILCNMFAIGRELRWYELP